MRCLHRPPPALWRASFLILAEILHLLLCLNNPKLHMVSGWCFRRHREASGWPMMWSFSVHSCVLYIWFPRLSSTALREKCTRLCRRSGSPHRQDRESHTLLLSHNKNYSSMDDKEQQQKPKKKKKKKREPKQISPECHLRLYSLSGSIFTPA